MKIIGFYLFLGLFVNLYIYFVTQATLKREMADKLKKNKLDEFYNIGSKLLELSYSFDWITFGLGVVLWPMLMYFLYTEK